MDVHAQLSLSILIPAIGVRKNNETKNVHEMRVYSLALSSNGTHTSPPPTPAARERVCVFCMRIAFIRSTHCLMLSGHILRSLAHAISFFCFFFFFFFLLFTASHCVVRQRFSLLLAFSDYVAFAFDMNAT